MSKLPIFYTVSLKSFFKILRLVILGSISINKKSINYCIQTKYRSKYHIEDFKKYFIGILKDISNL